MPPGDERASRPPDFSFLLFSRSLEEEGRGARPQHYALGFGCGVCLLVCFVLLLLNRTRREWKFTLDAGKLETIIFVHDSTVSSLLVSPPFLCVVLLSSIAGNGFRMMVHLGEGANKTKDIRERTELKERSQICTLDKLSPT